MRGPSRVGAPDRPPASWAYAPGMKKLLLLVIVVGLAVFAAKKLQDA
jgi:hypothetical protein